MVDEITPIVPEGTPLPTPPVGVPPYPITPFAVWTWDSPVIPSFYWNVYSAEQRVKMICKEIGKIEAYLNYLVNKTNENLIDLQKQITKLDTRLTALEKKLQEEVARLDALIAKLRDDLTAETKAREDADKVLHSEISTETQNRIHADDSLHTEISTEVQARQDADSTLEAKLTTEIAKRLLPTEVTAGEEISITQPDPNSNRIVIASTVAHSISDLKNEVSGVKSALEAEVSERRSEDSKLWQAVNQRIERGKILAGSGIKVVNDPDSTTVTISTTGSGSGGVTPIKGVAPVLVLPNEETGGYSIGIEAATESTAGVITEARVKELAPKATTTTVTGTSPITVSGSSESGYTIGATAATTSTPGVITEARVKELAPGTTVAGTSPITVSGSSESGYTIGATAATTSTPGVVKIGSGISVNSEGEISVNSDSSFTSYVPTNVEAQSGVSSVNLSRLRISRQGSVIFITGYFQITLSKEMTFTNNQICAFSINGMNSNVQIGTAGVGTSPIFEAIPVVISFNDVGRGYIIIGNGTTIPSGTNTINVNSCSLAF